MVILLTLVPVWIVLWRRMQAGRWTELLAGRSERRVDAAARARARGGRASHCPHGLTRGRRGSLPIGAWLAACVAVVARRRTRRQYVRHADARGRNRSRARTTRVRHAPPKWRVMGVPDDGSGGRTSSSTRPRASALARAARRVPAEAALARARRDVRRRRGGPRGRVAGLRHGGRRGARRSSTPSRSARRRVARRGRGAQRAAAVKERTSASTGARR